MNETLEQIRERKGFYSHYYRLAVRALVVSMIIILLLITGIMLVRASQNTPDVYATSSDGTLEKLETSIKPPYNVSK